MVDGPGIDNESIASQGNSENNPLSETPQVEQPMGGATGRKYMGITVGGSGIYDEHNLGDINLRPDEFQAKRKEMFKNLIDSPNFKQALKEFQTQFQIRAQISDFLKSNMPSTDSLESLSPEARQSMMEKWLGTPSDWNDRRLSEKTSENKSVPTSSPDNRPLPPTQTPDTTKSE